MWARVMASSKVISRNKQIVVEVRDNADLPIRNCGLEVWARNHILAKSFLSFSTTKFSVVSSGSDHR